LIDQAVQEATKRVAAERGGASPKFDVYTTGHSLGGGLAQLMAYAEERVKGAVVFDPSPVTGYFTTVAKSRVNCNARILRVYERGEVLQYLRAMTRRFYTPTTNVAEVDFNVIHTTGAGGVLNHSIVNFTDKLDKAVLSLGEESLPAGRTHRRQLMERFLPTKPDLACMDRKLQ
jgi:pimeloyl-ACP methyl ester carboxylesterase